MRVENLRQDVRYGIRGLLRERSFACTTIATLAIALSLVTVVFAIFNAYVLRPYAVRDPYSLYQLRWRTQDAGGDTFQWSRYQELTARQELFSAVMVERNRTAWFDGQRVLASFVSGNYFESLGGRIALGRGLAPFDAQTPGGDPVAVLSHRAWTRLFDARLETIGRTLTLNGQTLTIVGIAHEEFSGVNDTPPDVWVPVTMHAAVMRQDLFGATQPRELRVIARLQPGVTPAQAGDALGAFMTEAAGRSLPARAELRPQATPAPLTLEMMMVLSPVFAAFVLVLLAACANVSNVMLARANARHREIGIRLSLGASRGRVVRQLFTEGLLIATAAGLAALALASLILSAGLRVLFLSLPPSAAAITRVVPLDLDRRVFLFTFVIAAATTTLFALLPALHATRVRLTDALRGVLGDGLQGSRLRNGLVVSQVTVSLVLVIAAATLARNSLSLGAADLGLDTGGVYSIRQRSQGIRSSNAPPPRWRRMDGSSTSPSPAATRCSATCRRARSGSPARRGFGRRRSRSSLPRYFDILRIPIVRGRPFRPEEASSEANVAIISAAAAATMWPGADPLGQTIRLFMPPPDRSDLTMVRKMVSIGDVESRGTDLTIVGISSDVMSGLVYQGRDAAHVYMPTSVGQSHATAILVRGRSPRDLRPEGVQETLQSVDANPLAFEVLPLEEALALQMYPLRVASWIGLLLGGIALALCVSGLFGVVTYGLSQRTKEIGIRMALGATSTRVVRLLMAQAVRLLVLGSSIGLVLTVSALAMLRSFVPLDNVSLLDAVALSSGVAAVAAAAAIATYYPARRATRIDPSAALRAEG